MAEQHLFVTERWEKISNALGAEGRVTVEQVAQELGVSTSTIRRDLGRMHKGGLAIRTRGGAIKPEQVSFDRSLADSLRQQVSEKEEVGAFAASMIESGDTVIIDGGATTLQIAKHLRTTMVMVVTNSVDIAYELKGRDGIGLILIGGIVRGQGGFTYGPAANSEVSRLSADKAFVGANGISAEHGLTAPEPLIADLKSKIVQQTRQVIVVADHTKLGHVGLCQVAPIASIHTLVTDRRATEEQISPFRDAGVEVIVVR